MNGMIATLTDIKAKDIWWATRENPNITFKVNGKEYKGIVKNIGSDDKLTIDVGEELPAGEISIIVDVPGGLINPNNILI